MGITNSKRVQNYTRQEVCRSGSTWRELTPRQRRRVEKNTKKLLRGRDEVAQITARAKAL